MKIHYFVSGSACIIAAWLMVTFLHEVSPQQYPQQRRSAPTHAAMNGAVKASILPLQGITSDAALLATPMAH
jgi:hypothetical protein